MAPRTGLRSVFLAIATLCLASPGALAANMVVDATGCLHVTKTGPSPTCASKSSLTVELKNSCKMPISAQLCLRGGNHVWAGCAAEDSLEPEEKFFESSCDSDGDYTYWGCSKVKGVTGHCGGDDLVGKATNVPK